MPRLFLFATILASPLMAQHFGFGFGVKGGVPFTDLLEATGTITEDQAKLAQSDNYLVGPAIELRIPFGFAIEADGLYRGTEYSVANITGTNLPSVVKSSSWEIPYLAKFRFPIPVVKPFVLAGGSYRTFNDLPSGISATHNAFVIGGGVELIIKKVRLSGEARYLHWNAPHDVSLRLTQSQGELLFGIMF